MLLFVVMLIGLVAPTTIPPLPACEHLKYTYSSRGVPEYDIPGKPVQGLGLQFCPSGPTCCTRSVEERLGAWSEKQYRDALFNRTTAMAADLDRKAQQIDDYVYVLLNKAQREFHDMFTRTYGIMYQKNAEVFQEYFKDLKVYYDKGALNPALSTTNFFNTLYQKMFQVLNSQYTFDGLYLGCVSENMEDLHPFGDVPRKLASSVKRSLVAARALVKALRTGHEIANQMTKVEPRPNCVEAVKKMSSCPACKGLPEVKPCNGYCINIMKGCMAHHYEIDAIWNSYIDSLTGLTERLIGPFNVELTIEPISIKISDAIMNFQESGFQVTQKVFELCGTPRLGRRRRSATSPSSSSSSSSSSQFVFEKRLEKIHRTPARPVKSEFELMLSELKKKLKGVEGFWSRLPYQMCDTQMERPPFRNLKDRESCWNGRDVGQYEAKVLEDGLANQMQNPEVPVVLLPAAGGAGFATKDQGSAAGTLLADLRTRLESLANQLRSAYRGLDIEWWDREDGGGGEHQQQRDAEGSGGDGLEDDEDYAAAGGSGEGSGEDEILVPAWTKEREQQERKKTTKFETDSSNNGASDRKNSGIITSGGASIVHLRTKAGLGRAVLTYLLPVVTCYLGGAFAHLPSVIFS